MKRTFGANLKVCRRNTQDPERGGPLSQEHFAELLGTRLGTKDWPYLQIVSNWEHNKHLPRADEDRNVLVAIVSVLAEHGGLRPMEEANELLASGGYAPLTEEERATVAGFSPRPDHNTAKRGVPAKTKESFMKPSPFVLGRPISDPSIFVGRQQQTREVLSHLTNLDSSSVVGEWRIGKTSFLRYVSHPDVLRRFGLDPGQYLFAFVSLSEDKRQETPGTFWRAVVSELNAQLRDEELREVVAKAEASAAFGSDEMTALVDEIGRHGRRVVLLLDEFELIAGNPNFDLSFFNSLRSLAQNHPLALITASRRELIELCHSKQIESSPFFNIFTVVDLGLFSPHEADELVDRVLAGTSVILDATEKARIGEVTGRHPLLLQMTCHYLFQAYEEDLAEEPRWGLVLKHLRRQSSAHFQSYWDHCTQDERIALTAAAMLEGIEDKGTPDVEELKTLASHSLRVLAQLKRRALLVESEGRHAVFSPLFAEWIIDEVRDPTAEPDQEFMNWMATLRGDPELGRVIKRADKDGAVTNVLSKVKPQYRDMIRQWLHNESTGNVTRLLLIVVETVRLATDFLHF